MFRGFRTISLLSAALLVCGLLASPGLAAKPGGKKPIGEIVSFDESSMTLVVEMKSGSELVAEVADEAQIKLEHRGDHSTGKGHGNPTRGSLDDLVEGAKVLRLKLDKDEGVVSKIRLRAAPKECDVEDTEDDDSDDEESDDDGSDETEEDTDGTEDETECPDDESDDETDECDGDDTDDDSDDAENDDSDDDGKAKSKNKSKNKTKNEGENKDSEC